MNQTDISAWVGNELVPQRGQLAKKDILLVLLLVDDSSSIQASGNTQAVIDGYNGFIEALKNASGEVRIKTVFLNNRRWVPFQHPREVELLSGESYHPGGQTPLFLRSGEALESIVNEAKALSAQGFIVRTMSFIFTDGGDNQSGLITASNVKVIVDEMLTTGTHVVGGCAVNDGSTDFWKVFASMGIPEQWVKVLKNDPREVRDSMAQMGTMASHASTNQDSYTQTSKTGFGSTRREQQ